MKQLKLFGIVERLRELVLRVRLIVSCIVGRLRRNEPDEHENP
jgi:hypothetical protein